MAAAGSANERTSASPGAITSTAPNAADCGAPNSDGDASGLRSSPCSAAPERPRMAPIANARMARGSRISCTMIRCSSLPPPNSACDTVSGDSRTGPTPSETSASSTTSDNKCRRHAGAPLRGDVGRHHDVLNTHP